MTRTSGRLLLRRTSSLLFVAATLLVTSAHVGSPDTWFSGDAGPYQVLVHVRSPGTIPGMATLEVRVQGDPPDEVLAGVDARGGAAPPTPVRALPVTGQPGMYRTSLWVTEAGPGSITVQVRGPRGEGAAEVSVTLLPFQRLQVPRGMSLGLGLVALILFGALIAGVGAAVRDSPSSGAGGPSVDRRRMARLAMAGTAVLIAVGILAGKRWWDAQDRAYFQAMGRPLTAVASVTRTPAGPEILLRVTDPAWGRSGRGSRGYGPLIPDHGKLMHMFVISQAMGMFAHIHPSTSDSVSFRVALPPLPAGPYRVFADVTHENGLSQTLTASLDVPEDAGAQGYGAPRDADDSWFQGTAAKDEGADLTDGSVLHWERGPDPVVVGALAPLHFLLTDSAGAPLAIEPYMGMAAHAVVLRDDDSVFVHLHPTGTVSAAAQLALSLRATGDTTQGTLASRVVAADAMHAMHMNHGLFTGPLTIPYAFPSAGRYTIWVQVKHGGEVLTGSFVVAVGAAPAVQG
jgi:hypothetical protein